jgi:hypothetical protein
MFWTRPRLALVDGSCVQGVKKAVYGDQKMVADEVEYASKQPFSADTRRTSVVD